MKLFPFTLIRIGGDTFEHWKDFSSEEINQLLQRIALKDLIKETLKKQLSELLLAQNQSLDDRKTQNAIQNIRRAIFNEKPIKAKDKACAEQYLSHESIQLLKDYQTLINELTVLSQEGQVVYKEEISRSRAVLQKLAYSEGFRKGMVLSSKSLLARLDSYVKKPIAQFKKKEFQTELSLLQYLSRVYTKTSPFSTFTNLATGKINQKVRGIGIRHTKGENVKGHIRLNNFLLSYLLNLLNHYLPIKEQVPVRINPTVQVNSSEILFLTNFNNHESFQRVPLNPVVLLIKDIINQHGLEMPFKQLVNKLKEEIEASEQELLDYLQQLLDYGFLELHYPVSGIDPDWDLRMVEFLKDAGQEDLHIQNLVAALNQTRALGRQYEEADVNGRQQILQRSYNTIRTICMQIHEAAGLPAEERKTYEQIQAEMQDKARKAATTESETSDQAASEKDEATFSNRVNTFFNFRPEQIYYEDTTRSVQAELNEKQLQDLVQELGQLLYSLRLFEGNRDECDKMRRYYKQKYNENASVSLFSFYEDYYRDIKKPELERREKERQQRNEASPADLQKKDGEQALLTKDQGSEVLVAEAPVKVVSKKEKNSTVERWRKVLTSTLEACTQDEVDLDGAWIDEANSKVSFDDVSEKSKSYGAFVQLSESNGQLKMILNASFVGYGKMTSRFLHILDDRFLETTREWNNLTRPEGTMYAENCDASFFNANIHPPLMDKEICAPGGHNTLPIEDQIPITELSVRLNSEKEMLELVHEPSGQSVHLFDLGFQGYGGRSQLFQLLQRFTDAEQLHVGPLLSVINEHYRKINQRKVADDVPAHTIEPRVVFKNNLILQRKTWTVPVDAIPHKNTDQTDWDYFIEVNRWRNQLQLPSEVFVYVNTDRWGLSPNTGKKLTRDDYKPQYINFTEPLMINLFKKLVGRVPHSMKLVEMLPASEDMLKIDDRRYVTEFVVQWYGIK